MGEDDMRDLLIDSDFDGPLVDYKAKGNTVEFLGHDMVDGDDALRLKVTLKNGDIIYYYLDPDTFLEIRKEMQEFIRGSVRENSTDLGSYKPVAGVMYPFSIAPGPKTNPAAQTQTIEKIEVNVPIDKADFAVPASLKQPELMPIRSEPALSNPVNGGQPKPLPQPEQLSLQEDFSMNAADRKCGWMIKLSLGSGIALLSCAVLSFSQGNYKFDAATVSGLPARNIGSATMSGRIAAIDAVEQEGRLTVFVGAASGGVWKSVNGGTTFKSVFDRQSVQSIGAVAIDPSNTKTVWVGSGEGWVRNSVSIGDGIYKSTDSGENWTNVGLEEQRAHRENPG